LELLALSFQATKAVEDFATLIFLSEKIPLFPGETVVVPELVSYYE
jgi:hypothetical protein